MKEKYSVALCALERLRQGNKTYVNSTKCVGDISLDKRRDTFKNGQTPYAVVVSCSDSRVIPECIFSAGIGDLFVIRVAGNVVDNFQLGSVEYAVKHLGCKLVVVLGHTGCGAVGSEREQHDGCLQLITDEILHAVGAETDTTKAVVLNAMHSVSKVQAHLTDCDDVLVVGALYHTESGDVEFFSPQVG